MTPAIEYRNCTKVFRYGHTGIRWQIALRGVSLQVWPGEIVALLGMSGAGRTTALHCALDLVRPSGGSVAILGHPSSGSGWRGRAGYLPETARLRENIDVEVLLRTAASLHGLTGAARRKGVGAWIERLSLPRGILHGSGWSRENDRRCCIAAALIGEPDVLFLDEPTCGLDPGGRTEVRSLLLEAKRRGAALLVSSHDLQGVEEIADRVVILKQGELVATGNPRSLMPDGGGFQIIVHWADRHGGDRPGGRRVLYHARDGEEAGRILSALRGDGGEIISVTQTAPTLEEAFQRYAV